MCCTGKPGSWEGSDECASTLAHQHLYIMCFDNVQDNCKYRGGVHYIWSSSNVFCHNYSKEAQINHRRASANTSASAVDQVPQNVVARPWQRSTECRTLSNLRSSWLVHLRALKLFNRILAPYVENLDMNQVNYGIGQGKLPAFEVYLMS
jgi:hypothetical protein